MGATVEKFEFQAEARQLLDLMVHSVYSNKDIFLRELISNASDAIDKRRFESVTNPDVLPAELEPHIVIDVDKSARTLTVHDDGIGMSKDEVIENIGTIAKSGTQEFLARLRGTKEAAIPQLIGQFGVGFYASFMAADKVELLTRRATEQTATRWESGGDGTYTIEEAERAEPGTSVTLHLKPSQEDDNLDEYLEEWKIREIVKRYSDFVAYPIQMDVTRTVKDNGEEKPVTERETLNSMKALWLKDKEETSDEEVREFYKHISHDWNDPLEVIRAKIEGLLEYRLMLFIPSKAPFDLFYRDGRFGLQLYVKRVFIMDDCQELVPEYLRFLKGVVDSEDLSLNISREILQQDRQVRRMRKGIVNKVLDALKKLSDDEPEKYGTFWTEFGRVLKEGIHADADNRDALLDLMRCASTNSEEELTSLQDYIDRMPEEQEAVYYLTGETREAVERSPHLEAFAAKGYEVLLLTDPVDDIWLQAVTEYKGHKFQSAAKGVADLGTEEDKEKQQEAQKAKEEHYGTLLERLKKELEDDVKDVRLSGRLTESPACLVGDAEDLSPQLERLMSSMGQKLPKTKRILELNPNHPIMAKLQDVFTADPNAPDLADYAQLLYGQAILAEGGDLPEPARFSRLVADLMVKAV